MAGERRVGEHGRVVLKSELTELTAAATDGVYALVAIASLVALLRRQAGATWRVRLWSGMLGLSAIATILGAAYHALVLTPAQIRSLWHPIYLALGVSVALFLTATAHDWRGEAAARRALAPLLGIGLAFTIYARFVSGEFVVFAVYQFAATLFALAVYVGLALRRRLPGAGWIGAGVGLSLVAGAVSMTEVAFVLIWPFDNYGAFHLVQTAATLVLVRGVITGLDRQASGDARSTSGATKP